LLPSDPSPSPASSSCCSSFPAPPLPLLSDDVDDLGFAAELVVEASPFPCRRTRPDRWRKAVICTEGRRFVSLLSELIGQITRQRTSVLTASRLVLSWRYRGPVEDRKSSPFEDELRSAQPVLPLALLLRGKNSRLLEYPRHWMFNLSHVFTITPTRKNAKVRAVSEGIYVSRGRRPSSLRELNSPSSLVCLFTPNVQRNKRSGSYLGCRYTYMKNRAHVRRISTREEGKEESRGQLPFDQLRTSQITSCSPSPSSGSYIMCQLVVLTFLLTLQSTHPSNVTNLGVPPSFFAALLFPAAEGG